MKRVTKHPVTAAERDWHTNLKVYQIDEGRYGHDIDFEFEDWVVDAVDYILDNRITYEDILMDTVPFLELFKYFRKYQIQAPEFLPIYWSDTSEIPFCTVSSWNDRFRVATFDGANKYAGTWKGVYSFITKVADKLQLIV